MSKIGQKRFNYHLNHEINHVGSAMPSYLSNIDEVEVPVVLIITALVIVLVMSNILGIHI